MSIKNPLTPAGIEPATFREDGVYIQAKFTSRSSSLIVKFPLCFIFINLNTIYISQRRPRFQHFENIYSKTSYVF